MAGQVKSALRHLPKIRSCSSRSPIFLPASNGHFGQGVTALQSLARRKPTLRTSCNGPFNPLKVTTEPTSEVVEPSEVSSGSAIAVIPGLEQFCDYWPTPTFRSLSSPFPQIPFGQGRAAMETPATQLPTHQFQAQNSHYPEPQQYGPHQNSHQSQVQGPPVVSQEPKPAPIAAPSSTTTTPVNKERTRHSSACFPCAKRKVKCDRDVKNPCSNCLKRDQGNLCEVKSQKDRLSGARYGPSPFLYAVPA